VDRARTASACRNGDGGTVLKQYHLLLICLAACTSITGDSDRAIALVIDGLPERVVEEGDTLTLTAAVVTASGDTIRDAAIVWTIADPDTGQPGFTLDSLTGIVKGLKPDTGNVRPRFEDTSTLAVITVIVTPAPDSAAAVGDIRIAMEADDSVSPPMVVAVFDRTTDSSTVLPLANKPVQFHLISPAPESTDASGFQITPSNSGLQDQSQHRAVATTDEQGQARAVVKRLDNSVLPDSAVVEAVVVTAVGGPVEGSPVRFVVLFGDG
jgi:hypothetical protein